MMFVTETRDSIAIDVEKGGKEIAPLKYSQRIIINSFNIQGDNFKCATIGTL